MAAFNKVVLIGNLTRKPILQHTPGGTACADVGLAINDDYKGKDGGIIKRAVFVDVVVWGKQAEATAEHMGKGSPVLVEGKLQLDQWENKEGEKRSKLRIRADKVVFLQKAPSSKPAPTDAEAPAEYVDDMPF